ncbi:DNA primase family protein [Microbacterium arborescens]
MTDSDDQPTTSLASIDRSKDQTSRSHLRLAYRFAERHKNEFIYVPGISAKGRQEGWMRWTGTHWELSEGGEIHNALWSMLEGAWAEAMNDTGLQNDIRSAQSASGTEGVLRQAARLPEFARAAKDLDNDRMLLNLRNGTYDLRSFKMKPHDPRDLITKVSNAEYHEDATAPRWDVFVQEVLPDRETREFLQRYVGVALSGEVREHALPILVGDGRNGKGTFYEAIQYLQGEYSGQADPELFMHKEGAHPVGQMALLGKRFVVVTETQRGRRMNAATMKRLTGGDPITARWMHGNPVTFEPSHTPILVTNWMPKISGDERAAWERIHVVEFNTYIPPEKRDKHLKETLRTEVDGILLWALRGWHDYLSRGWQLDPPQSVLLFTEEQREDVDYIAHFIDDNCVIDPSASELQAELRSRYNAWRIGLDKARDEAPEYERNDFSRVVRQYSRAIGTKKGSKNRSYFTGIRLKNPGE